jgi:signal transduction histidine kinase
MIKDHVLKPFSPAQSNMVWGLVLLLLVGSQIIETQRAEVEAALPVFKALNRTQLSTAIMLGLIAIAMLRTRLPWFRHVRIAVNALLLIFFALVVQAHLTGIIFGKEVFVQLSQKVSEALPGVPSLETAFAAMVAGRMLGAKPDWVQAARFFTVFSLVCYGTYELTVLEDKVLHLTDGSGMGPATIVFFCTILVYFAKQQGPDLLPEWRLSLFPTASILILMSWFTNVPEPDRAIEYIALTALFITILLGFKQNLSFSYENAALARKNAAQAKRIEQQNADLSLLVTSLSHDLKAPIRNGRTLIRQRNSLKQAKGLTDQDIDEMQLRTLDRMEALSRNFVEYIMSHSEPMRIEPINLSDLLLEVSEPFAARAKFELRVPDHTLLPADRQALARSFENLFENAIQHAKSDDLHLRLEVIETKKSITITLEDNGQGIAPELHERVFKPFETFEAKHKSGSSGLGLSIVRRLVERMEGRISSCLPRTLGGACFAMSFKKEEHATS